MREKICGIYKIINKVNLKTYVGQSIDILRRWSEHRKIDTQYSRATYPLYAAICKYGIDNFDFEIIEICDAKDLNKREKYWIKQLNSLVEKLGGWGYNLTEGGQLCDAYVGSSDQGKETFQYTIDGCFINKYRNRKRAAEAVGLKSGVSISRAIRHNGLAGGFQWRDYATDKIAAFHRPRYRKRVYQYNVAGEFMAEFCDTSSAADAMSVSQSLIELCCEMKCRTGAGYIWRYTKEDKIAPVSKIVQPSKWLPVDQFDLSGNFIKTYPCAQVASDETGVPLTSIRHTLYGESKTAYGYVFRYTSERKEDKNCEKM